MLTKNGIQFKSRRYSDMRAEKELGKFMNRYFYEKLDMKLNVPVFFERKGDEISQLQGIDIELHVGNDCFLIDEKAALYYSNVMIPTFAFEVDSIQKGHDEPCVGWLVNSDLRTEYYMLIWPNIKCEKKDEGLWERKRINDIKEDDFTIVEAMLLCKKTLIEWLRYQGWNLEKIDECCKALREHMANQNCTGRRQISNEMALIYSGTIPEKPINLVIKKDVLLKLAKAVFLISKDGFARI